jgi:hypothetical protein
VYARLRQGAPVEAEKFSAKLPVRQTARKFVAAVAARAFSPQAARPHNISWFHGAHTGPRQ